MPVFYQKLQAGSPLPAEISQELGRINAIRGKSFPTYLKNLSTLFRYTEEIPLRDQYKNFLAGFILSEGSINVSAKKNKGNTKGKIFLDLEFSVTQHANKASILIDCCRLFNAGRIKYKVGSNATLVYTISDRKTIGEKVLPFYKSFVFPYATAADKDRFSRFSTLHACFQKGLHLQSDTLASTMLPIWDSLRQQEEQVNESFRSLKDALLYIKNGC